ncbi:hypothetical protein N657DRAFT_367993 [Parathielavia appendiculata]|uniref:Uncharacterized protein n=1 Tax=Parathielavia appendiculata TaxID=2587402 RepID=A0AAN6TQ96_9PEZI|nr:hypothetical protein N657DRAFT_367993 [Parathielavia appendiculata]
MCELTRPWVVPVTTFLLADEDEGSTIHRDFSSMWDAKQPWMVVAMRRRLQSRTIGLLEISPSGTVRFLHCTVPEWVTRKENCQHQTGCSGKLFDRSLEFCKARTTDFSQLQGQTQYRPGIP